MKSLSFKTIFLALITILKASLLNAENNPIIFKDAGHSLNISQSLQILEDKEGKLSFNEAVKKEFTTTKSDVPNLGISNSVFWVKMNIINLSDEEKLMLDLSLPTLDQVDFYFPNNNGVYDSIAAGERFRFYQRKYIDPDYLFDLSIPVNEGRIFYLKISSKEGIQLPIKIGTSEVINAHIRNRDVLSGLYFGIMLAMIFYNLFVFISVKDRNYIYYVIYIILILITQTSLQGYPFQYLWPEHPLIAQKSLFIFPSLVSMAGLVFMRHFLLLKQYNRVLYVLSFVLYTPYLISILLAILGNYNVSFHMMETGSMTVSVFMLLSSIIILRKGYEPAKYFLVAWVVFLTGVFIYILKDFGVLPFNNFTRYTMHIGSGIETVLLSFALAARINIYKKEKEDSQAKALALLRENERIIVEQNTMLEIKVKERTAELEASNKSLKEAEAHIVNVEKMASLGRLTAGISHEINNPINFVVASVKPLKRDVDDILTLLRKYEEIDGTENLSEKLDEIKQLKEELDIEYSVEEIGLLLKGIDEGAFRTSEIVKGLKNFSRLEEAELEEFDIHEGIDGTLAILNNNIIQGGVRISKKFGVIPKINCYPGKLNQVFMNIINNAIHAIISKKSAEQEGVIEITTSVVDNLAEIRIKDNGIGIPKENLDKIFEPFFTTKQVGMGTGLGLSIVFGIINSHNGQINIVSEEGQGSEFIIHLPVKPARN